MLDLPATFVFDYPTPDEMAAFITKELPSAPVAPTPVPSQHQLTATHAQPHSVTPWLGMQSTERRAYVTQQVGTAVMMTSNSQSIEHVQ